MEKPGVLKNDMGNGKAHGKTVLEQTSQKIRNFVISAWKCLIKVTSAIEEYIMRNPGLEEAHAGIKIAGRNINNLRYAEDTTLMAESEEELKSLLMKVKVESEKVGLCTIALISHASKVMSLLLNMLSRLVITFLPRSKPLLISWLKSPSVVILEPKK